MPNDLYYLMAIRVDMNKYQFSILPDADYFILEYLKNKNNYDDRTPYSIVKTIRNLF